MTAPAPTSAAATVDYIPAGVRRYVFFPTMAGEAPTSAELTAGTEYTSVITAIAGFQLTADDIDNTAYAATFKSSIPGMRSAASSSWTLKASNTSTDGRAQLTTGLNGYVADFNEGIATPATKYDVWPVRIKSSNTDQVAMDALATYTIEFSHPSAPLLQLAIPTS